MHNFYLKNRKLDFINIDSYKPLAMNGWAWWFTPVIPAS
jgi:hypothetical protein